MCEARTGGKPEQNNIDHNVGIINITQALRSVRKRERKRRAPLPKNIYVGRSCNGRAVPIFTISVAKGNSETHSPPLDPQKALFGLC
jgi:hypothetical protein